MTAQRNISFRYDNRVVVITGAGGGIGRSHALEFARRGARVVVNDLGVGPSGEPSQTAAAAADSVVAEIREIGGEAVASYSSVEDGQQIIEQCLDEFGKIDVLINNAGISNHSPFSDISLEQWRQMYRVHVEGTFICSKAAWPHMLANNYGRILLTSSPGLYGIPTLAHYSSAKSAMLGLAGALTLEGVESNIHCNTIAPTALSRMSALALPEEILATLEIDPNDVAQLAAWLCHESNSERGSCYEVGGRFVAKMRMAHSEGVKLDVGNFTAEAIENNREAIDNFAEPFMPQNSFEMGTRTGINIDPAALAAK